MVYRFIVFEGPHGSGKTTQAKLLKKYLDESGIAAIYTKEPYLHDLKRLIDEYSLIDTEISSHVLLYLHAADRFAHVQFIKEEIEKDSVIIADRYLLSSYVYQQIQGISLELIERTNFFCIEPDVTFIFDVPLFERKKRLHKGNRLRSTLFFKDENISLEEKLYHDVFDMYKQKWKKVLMIDGSREIEEIHKEVIKSLEYL